MWLIGRIRYATTYSRSMSAYSSRYRDPVFSKEQQVELKKSANIFKVGLIPTKAALNHQTCSVFHGELRNKFSCYLTRNGEKELGRELLEESFAIIKRIQLERCSLNENGQTSIIIDPEKILALAVENCRPILIVSPVKRGGVKYQVPIPVSKRKSYYLAMKWILDSAKEKERNVDLPSKLAWEIIDAAYGQGRVIKKKLDLHRFCEGNRAYAHYRWS